MKPNHQPAAAWFGTLPQSPANIVTLNQAA
jgi:hypothetical protein